MATLGLATCATIVAACIVMATISRRGDKNTGDMTFLSCHTRLWSYVDFVRHVLTVAHMERVVAIGERYKEKHIWYIKSLKYSGFYYIIAQERMKSTGYTLTLNLITMAL